MIRMLSIIIPAFNEEHRIASTIKAAAEHLKKAPYAGEIIVVNDGSRDGTLRRVMGMSQQIPQLRLVNHPKNQGKGAAVRTGFMQAQGDCALFCDADGAVPMEELGKFLPLMNHSPILIAGSRRVQGSKILVKQSFLRRWMSSVYHWFSRRMVCPGISDVICGFKLLDRKAIQLIAPRMRIKRWSFDAEMLAIAQLHGVKVVEVPVVWSDRQGSKVRLLRDAVGSFWELLSIGFYRLRGIYR